MSEKMLANADESTNEVAINEPTETTEVAESTSGDAVAEQTDVVEGDVQE